MAVKRKKLKVSEKVEIVQDVERNLTVNLLSM
jgi:hypothetical protein